MAFVFLISMTLLSCDQKAENNYSYPVVPLPISEVELSGGFWAPVLQANLEQTLPHIFRFCELTGRFDNFSRAGGLSLGPHKGERYNDTDVFKAIEGASYQLQQEMNDTLVAYLDSIIMLIEAAQEEDGYLYTPRSIDPETNVPGGGSKPWEDVWISHELYNAGHLYEAAVAYYYATGKRRLLDVALRNADLVISVFNDRGLQLAPGHQEIELGLVKLFNLTGEQKYLDQALFFLDQRGKEVIRESEPAGGRFEIYNEPSYLQYHLPVRDQKKAVGHAVRAMYMYAGMTDAGYFGKDTALLNRSMELWDDITGSKTYITGGVGASHRGEAFSSDYVLPNETAYCETCAAAGFLFWNHRLFSLTADPKYLDLLETTLYNGFLSGVSQDGKKFFYPNPLESKGGYERSEWFGVACCPGNVARVIPSVPGYIYSKTDQELFVNLFISSRANMSFRGIDFTIDQETDYPASGEVRLMISPEKTTRLKINIRIPGWCGGQFLPGGLYSSQAGHDNQIVFTVNGNEVAVGETGNIVIDRRWRKGDEIVFQLPMKARFVKSDRQILSNRGKRAIVRGPIVYAVEGIDNGGSVQDIRLSKEQELYSVYDPELLGGTTVIHANEIKAVPYYLWANRGANDMRVWIPSD